MAIRILEKERFVDMRTEISYRIVSSSTERYVEHAHDYYEAFVMLTGRAKHIIFGKTFKMSAGDIFFVRPSDLHLFAPLGNEEFSFINLTFTKETFNAMRDYLGEGFPFSELLSSPVSPRAHLSNRELAALEAKIQYLASISHEQTERLKTSLRIMLTELISSHFSSFSEPSEKMPLWLERLLATMRSDGNYVLGINRMVELSGKTREHLSRTVKKHLGITVTEYINELRLNYISNMLRSSNSKITDIILDSGFTSISRATSLFKEKHGMSMREFRLGDAMRDKEQKDNKQT